MGFNNRLIKTFTWTTQQRRPRHGYLNREDVNAGDVFFLPAGRVHTIGKGLLIAEIQQTQILTYGFMILTVLMIKATTRVAYRRSGCKPLIITFTLIIDEYQPKDEGCQLVKCPYFTTNILDSPKQLQGIILTGFIRGHVWC